MNCGGGYCDEMWRVSYEMVQGTKQLLGLTFQVICDLFALASGCKVNVKTRHSSRGVVHTCMGSDVLQWKLRFIKLCRP